MGTEQNAYFYDRTFMQAKHFRSHYSDSPYWPIWSKIIDMLKLLGDIDIIELGCGSGQLAAAIRDYILVNSYAIRDYIIVNSYAIRDYILVNSYIGYDFSKLRIEHAMETLRGDSRFKFRLQDVNDLTFDNPDAIYIATEFFEHINNDLGIIGKIPQDSRIIFTVPDFDYVAHVRHFKSEDEVRSRYDWTINHMQIQKIGRIYLCDGRCEVI
jgi:SAM-dependent methyltransferase